MKKERMSRLEGALWIAVVAAGACGDDRRQFDPGSQFAVDPEQDASECRFRCSLDGRSVIQTCTGDVVESCPQELACGEARCQAPCAAAAADQRSDGCEFYFQAPRYTKVFDQSCHAVFVVNTSLQPANIF